jgi:RNA polymerase sigma-70 factor (ECF subfamily)
MGHEEGPRGSPDLDPAIQFPLLYEREYGAVYRTVRAMVLDPAEAEDLTQEAFARAYRARTRYQPTAPPGAWLHRIAVNTAISYLRRQRVAKMLIPKLYMPGTPAHEEVEDRSLAERALSVLSPKLRVVVVLSFYARMSREEISRTLKIPPGTVASRLGAALEAMRKALAEIDQEGTPERQGG